MKTAVSFPTSDWSILRDGIWLALNSTNCKFPFFWQNILRKNLTSTKLEFAPILFLQPEVFSCFFTSRGKNDHVTVAKNHNLLDNYHLGAVNDKYLFIFFRLETKFHKRLWSFVILFSFGMFDLKFWTEIFGSKFWNRFHQLTKNELETFVSD